MFRASRILLQKPPVRPVVNGIQQNSKPAAKPSGPKITPIGIAAILGGLAFASYMFKPSKQSPTPAMDNFKPQIAIVFASGDSRGNFQKLAPQLGFNYIDVTQDMGKMDALIQQGVTKFFIEGFKSDGDLETMCETVVQPDLIFKFDNNKTESSAPRVVNLGKTDNMDQIAEILKQRNLV